MLFLCFSFCFTPMPYALLTLSSLCSVWLCSSFLLFHSATTMQLHHVLLPFHGYAWCMPLTHAATYLGYVGTHRLDLIQTCTYSSSSIKGHKCQPENSSLVLLVFPHNSQWEYLLNRLLVPLVSLPFDFDSLEHSWCCCLLGCFIRTQYSALDGSLTRHTHRIWGGCCKCLYWDTSSWHLQLRLQTLWLLG